MCKKVGPRRSCPGIAQLVEHSPRLQSVVGSNPTQGSSSFSLEKKAVLGRS